MFVYPKTIIVLGKTMNFTGMGNYPHDCIAKDRYPNAAIYSADDGSWTTEHSHFCKVAIKESIGSNPHP